MKNNNFFTDIAIPSVLSILFVVVMSMAVLVAISIFIDIASIGPTSESHVQIIESSSPASIDSESFGEVRIEKATVYNREGDLVTLEDEQGELWDVENTDIDDDAQVLLYIANNNTIDDVTDDVVLEVYVRVS